MKILLTGKDGQVGFALHKKLVSLGEVIATNRNELDLENSHAIRTFIEKIKPDIIINAAAYTDVDKAETEIELAHKVNTEAPRVLAEKASQLNIPIIHFSTDYVFDGRLDRPYVESDAPNPKSAYGRSKLTGEEKIRQILQNHVILRTAWVYSPFGANFVKTMLRLGAEREEVRVVMDQIGSPTYALDIADALIVMAKRLKSDSASNLRGTFHLTGQGEATWADVSDAIFDIAKAHGRPAPAGRWRCHSGLRSRRCRYSRSH